MEENKEKEMNVQENSEPIIPMKKENQNNVGENNNQTLSPVKKNTGLVIALIVVILLLVGALVYVLFFNKDKEDKKDNNDIIEVTPTEKPQETEVPIATDEPSNENNDSELIVYRRTIDGDLSISKDDEDDDYVVEARIKAKSADAKLITVDNNYSSFVLYNDDGLYLYNVKTKKAEKVDLESNYKEYQLLLNEKRDKIIGIAYLKNDNSSGYYNVSLNKKLYDGQYKFKYDKAQYVNDFEYSFNQVNDSYFSIYVQGKGVYLLDSTKEKLELSTTFKDYEGGMTQYRSLKSNNKYIYTKEMCITDYCSVASVYNDSFKEIISNAEISYMLFSYYNDNIYFGEETYNSDTGKFEKCVISKYDVNGNKISSSEKSLRVYMIDKNNYVYEKDNNIFIENIDNASDVKEIEIYIKNWIFDDMNSGYYTRETLDSMGEKNKKEGLYIVVTNESEQKDEKGNYGMEYCYTPDKQVVEYPIKNSTDGRAKPVLYLYPEKETNVIVRFEKPELLTTTYPKYINSWNVIAKPNGDLTDKDGKYYYALYWDEKRYNEVDFKEGFYVEDKAAIKFLEEKLTYIGLNDKERNEFIMYWLPIMEANKKNLVYFELTKEREAGNKLIIEPKPDSLLRVSIHIKKVNEKTNIKEQKLETFKRSGFVAVEWGGMTY